jgi:hypothetical protein
MARCEIQADCVETLFAAASRLEGRFLGRVVFVEKGLSNSVTPGNVLT